MQCSVIKLKATRMLDTLFKSFEPFAIFPYAILVIRVMEHPMRGRLGRNANAKPRHTVIR